MTDNPFSFAIASPGTASLSLQGQARLLAMTYDRLIFGVTSIPLVGLMFGAWLYQLQEPITGLSVWIIAYTLASIGLRVHRKQLLSKLHALDIDSAVKRMRRFVYNFALIHGVSLSLCVFITAGHGTFEFTLLLYISLAAIMAANATHQTPVLGSFQRYFISCWGLSTLVIPWSFPDHWPFILPLSLIYTAAIYRHALIAHQFFVQQVKLEEEGSLLAERYRMAKEEAEAALQAKNQFLATASHDLRQPVHAMGFLIESIARRNNDPTLTPALRDLHASVRSVHMMFNALLDLSRIESGTFSVSAAAVDIAPLMQEVALLFREEAARRGLSLRVRVSGQCTIIADPTLLKQAFANLVHNAVRYTLQGGVLLSARRRGNDCLIEVWDTGVGVAQPEQDRIYTPFYRNEYAWHFDSEGHGLGLAVVARCAKLMGATYGLSSSVGKGSRFWLRLPRTTTKADSLMPQPMAPHALDTPHPPLSGTCLVVEDDPQVTSAWLSLMQAWGVDARCATEAAEAFSILESGFVPNAILCDQRLRSGESGFEILKTLFKRCPEASGAMVSGEFNSPQLQQAEQEGYLVLRKPLEVDHLYSLLARWLGTASSSDQTNS